MLGRYSDFPRNQLHGALDSGKEDQRGSRPSERGGETEEERIEDDEREIAREQETLPLGNLATPQDLSRPAEDVVAEDL